jgi:CHAT domain-containing protein/predicted negative regulator of RcsB-dependent stress response
MRRPGHFFFALFVGASFAAPVSAAVLAPSVDPVATFIAVADSVSRTRGDAGLSIFVSDNSTLVGACVAKLLDVAFLAAQGGDEAAAKENVAFAKKIAAAHEASGGTAVAGGLIKTYEKWNAAARSTRARAMALEEQSAAARKANDFPGAVKLVDQARSLYEKIGDAHSIAVNWGTRGLTHFTASDWDAALADYQKALTARRAVEDRILEGRTLNGLGSVHQQKAEYDASIDYYQQAIELRTKTGDIGGLGTSLTYLGHAYNATKRYVQARDCYERALPLLEAQGNPKQMVELLSGVAAMYTEMGRLEGANDAYTRAIQLCVNNDLVEYEVLCRRNLANNYSRGGRFVEALSEFDAAYAKLDAAGAAEKAMFYRDRGNAYTRMGELSMARDDLLEFEVLAGQLDNPRFPIEAQHNIAQLYREMGAFDRALAAIDAEINLCEQAGDGRGYREALALRGEIEMATGRFDAALATWQEALAQDQHDQSPKHVITDEYYIAAVHAGMGKTAEARAELKSVLARTRAEGLGNVEWAALLSLGHTFEKENADSAMAYYEVALGRIEASALDPGSAAVQTGYFSGQKRYFYEEVTRFYATTFAQTKNPVWSERAFRTMERAKSRGLLELLREDVAEQTSPEEDQVLDALYSLDPKQPGYADERAALENRYAEMRRVRVSHSVGTLGAGDHVVALSAVAAALPDKTVLLEYALGDSASFVWVVDREGHDLVQLPRRPVIEAEVLRLRDALARVQGGEDALCKSARSLYEALVRPAEARLKDAESVLIVPDGRLFDLPFEALLSSDVTASADWRKQPFFARSHETVYAPSATVYVSMKSRPAPKSYDRDLFAVGNPDFSQLALQGGKPLAPLPFAKQEVDAISARIKDSRKTVLTGREASEANVKHEFENGTPRVVHLATHGLVDPVEPIRSNVALSPGDHEDGYFYTLEILATPVRSQLVVMSACESARGQISRGEGVVGLSRAFLASGAGSVVASLWAVSDESTAELMRNFYDRMFGKKRSASRALNEARLALIDSEKYSHPFFWSPFVVTGTERAPW